jgi:hypothetical protein
LALFAGEFAPGVCPEKNVHPWVDNLPGLLYISWYNIPKLEKYTK